MLWPTVAHGASHVARKGEDFHSFHDVTWKANEDAVDSVTLKIFGVYDGHGGVESGEHVKNNLVTDFLSTLSELSASSSNVSSRCCWDQYHVKALQSSFVRLDEQCRERFKRSGTTTTVLIVLQEDVKELKSSVEARRAFVTIANVGDSSAYLDTGQSVTRLNEEHRAGANKSESKRVEEMGGSISREDPKSPYRLYPGGLMMTRTIGDRDAHQAIAQPAIAELALRIQTGSGGGRIILASDGLWDAIAPKETASLLRKNKSPSNCSSALIRECSRREGRSGDDVTVFVIDISDAPQTPFPRYNPQENAPNRPFFLWRPAVENAPEPVRALLNARSDLNTSELYDSPSFRAGDTVYDLKDASKKELKVILSEGPLTLVTNKGWVLSKSLAGAQSESKVEHQADPETEQAIRAALSEDAMDRSQSPPWTEPPPSRRKKPEEKQSETTPAPKQRVDKQGKKEQREKTDSEGRKRNRGRKRDSRNANAGQLETEPSSQQAPVHTSEWDHDLFAVGFPDEWTEAHAKSYFEGYNSVQDMVLKTNEETGERAVFFTFTEHDNIALEDRVCGLHLINACQMYVAPTRHAKDETM